MKFVDYEHERFYNISPLVWQLYCYAERRCGECRFDDCRGASFYTSLSNFPSKWLLSFEGDKFVAKFLRNFSTHFLLIVAS